MEESRLADVVPDRLVHNAHVINLAGESMRKKRAVQFAKPTPSRSHGAGIGNEGTSDPYASGASPCFPGEPHLPCISPGTRQMVAKNPID